MTTAAFLILAFVIAALVAVDLLNSPRGGYGPDVVSGGALIGRFLPGTAGDFGRRPFLFPNRLGPRPSMNRGDKRGVRSLAPNSGRPAAYSRLAGGGNSGEHAKDDGADGLEGLQPFGSSARLRFVRDVDVVSHAGLDSARGMEACSINHGIGCKK